MQKLKSVGQCFVALALVLVFFVSGFETAHATDGISGGDRGDFWGSGDIHTGTLPTELSYNALSELCILQNANIEQGIYDDQYPFSDSPYTLSATVRYDSNNGCYVISVSYRGNYYNCHNGSGALYLARYDDGANINAIRVLLDNLYTRVVEIFNLNGLGFSAVNEGIELLDTRLQYLTGYIAGFKDDPTVPSIMSKLDDLITAVENLSVVGGGDVNFDTSPITNKLDDVRTSIVDAILNIDSGSSNVVSAIYSNTAILKNAIDNIDTGSSSNVVSAIAANTLILKNAIDSINVVVPSTDFTPITTKLDSVATSLRSAIISAADDSRIISQLTYIVGQMQHGPTGAWQPTTLLDYIEGIYQKMGTGGGGDGGDSTIIDAALIVAALKDFQADFDDTFSDLKQIYPTEVTEQISNGQFDWSDINILNSVTPTDSSASAVIYRLPESNLDVVSNGNGLFTLDNYGSPLSTNYYLRYDGIRHNLTIPSPIGTFTATGNDISFYTESSGTFLNLLAYGQCNVSYESYAPGFKFISGVFENDANPSITLQYDTSYGVGTQNISVHAASGSNVVLPGYGIPVSSGGNYTDENGQQWLCDVIDFNACTYTKNVGCIVLDMDSGWNYYDYGQRSYYCNLPNFNADFVDAYSAGLTNEFEYVYGVNHNYSGHGFCYELTPDGNYSVVFCYDGDDVGSLNRWKRWISEHVGELYYPCVPEVYQLESSQVLSYASGSNRLTADCPMEVAVNATFSYSSITNDADGNWYVNRSDGAAILLSDDDCDALNSAFYYKEYDNAADVKFIAGTNMINVSSGDLTVDYVKGSKFFNWLYLYLSNLNGGSVDMDALLDKLDDIEDALSNVGGDIDIENNTNINIDNDNDSYNVFYVTDPDTGEDTSIVDISGDALTAFGRLLNFLYQVCFGDALDNFGDTVDDLTDFYVGVGGGVDVWAS